MSTSSVLEEGIVVSTPTTLPRTPVSSPATLRTCGATSELAKQQTKVRIREASMASPPERRHGPGLTWQAAYLEGVCRDRNDVAVEWDGREVQRQRRSRRLRDGLSSTREARGHLGPHARYTLTQYRHDSCSVGAQRALYPPGSMAKAEFSLRRFHDRGAVRRRFAH